MQICLEILNIILIGSTSGSHRGSPVLFSSWLAPVTVKSPFTALMKPGSESK